MLSAISAEPCRTINALRSKVALVSFDDEWVSAVVTMHIYAMGAHVNCDIGNVCADSKFVDHMIRNSSCSASDDISAQNSGRRTDEHQFKRHNEGGCGNRGCAGCEIPFTAYSRILHIGNSVCLTARLRSCGAAAMHGGSTCNL
jgi:hypothetical protein